MAEIFRAKTFGAAGFEKEFAIKLILPSLVDDTEFVEMFINEAKLTVNLYHANIVQVFDLGQLDGQYYIAMEFVHGKDLLDVLARCAEMNIKIPLDLVLFIAQEMLKGLDFAHRAKDPYGEELNIIHRDVSPSNIMISYAGDVKVGDFGVAKAAIQRTLTESGTLKGKVGYMSPEQVMGDEIDSRSDLFSASIVLFEALSMNRLFVGNSDLDVMLKVRDAEYEESLQKAGPLPGDLVEILRKGLAKHREDRFQTGGEFYQALVDFCFQHSIKVTGADLSNFMRELFADEIEQEKAQRRSEPSGEALSREMVLAEQSESNAQAISTPGSVGAGSVSAGAEPVSEGAESVSEGAEPVSEGAESVSEGAKPSGMAGNDPQPKRRQSGEKLEDVSQTPPRMAFRDTAQVDEPNLDGTEDEAAGSRFSDAEDGVGAGILEVSTAVTDGQPEVEPDDDDEPSYRYRDGSGLVFGPMGRDTLVNLLGVRRPRSDDRVSVDDGPWRPLDEVSELDVDRDDEADDDSADRVKQHREVDVEVGRAPAGNGSSSGESPDPRRAPEQGDDGRDGQKDNVPLTGVLEGASGRLADSSTDIAPPPEDMDEVSGEAGDAGQSESRATSDRAGESEQDESDETLQQLKDQYASYQGALAKIPFARILARLHRVGETGRLHVHRAEIEKSIFFRDGEPIFVQSNREEELLGHFLRSRDLITEAQLEEGLERLNEWGGRLGDALVAIGAIPAHSIFEHLSAQMREKLLEIFTWDGGEYGYYENQEPDTQAYSLGVDTYSILVDGCRNRVSIDNIRQRYEHKSFVSIFIEDPPPFEVDRLGLRARELRVLNQLESGDTLETLLDKFSPEQHEMIFRMIYLFHQAELITFEVAEKFEVPPLPEVES